MDARKYGDPFPAQPLLGPFIRLFLRINVRFQHARKSAAQVIVSLGDNELPRRTAGKRKTS
jgi:hypothetical protein